MNVIVDVYSFITSHVIVTLCVLAFVLALICGVSYIMRHHSHKSKKKKAEEHETKFLKNEEFLPQVIELANMGHDVTIPLRGFSMRPFLEDGRDRAVLVKIDRPLKVGDIVLTELWKGHYALHRLLHVSKTHAQMLGDGNLNPDPIVPIDQVKVIAKGFYRKGSKNFESVDCKRFRYYSWVWTKFNARQKRYLLAIWRRIPLRIRNHML